MNTKTTKFLAVLAVLAMAFSVFAVIAPAETDDAAETGIIKFNEDVVFPDNYKDTTTGKSSVSNVGLGNAINYTVATITVNDVQIPEYTVKGVLQYAEAGAGTVPKNLGMGDGNLLAFNWTITAENQVAITTTSTAPAAAGTSLAVSTTPTIEPCLIGAAAASGTYFLWEKDSEATEWTLDAKIVTTSATTAGDPTTGLVKLTSAATIFDGEKKTSAQNVSNDLIVVKSTEVAPTSLSQNATMNTVAATALYVSKNIYVAEGATLTITMPATELTGVMTHVAGIHTGNGSKVYGIGTDAKITIVDKTTLSDTYKSEDSEGHSTVSSVAINSHSSGDSYYDIIIKNITINAYGATSSAIPNKYSAGIFGQAITIADSKVTITEGNRAIWGAGNIEITGSTVNVKATERGIDSYGGKISFGTEDPGTDTTTITATIITDGAVNGAETDDLQGIKAKGNNITIGKSATVTASSIGIYAGKILTVNGTLNITGSAIGGLSPTIGGNTYELIPSGLVVGTLSSGTLSGKNVKYVSAITDSGVVIGDDGKINLSKGVKVMATFTDSDAKATFGTAASNVAPFKPTYIVASQDSTLTKGSVDIVGEFTTNTLTGEITITGKAVMIGKLDVNLKLSTGAEILIPAGETLVFDGITIDATAEGTKIIVLGEVSGTADATDSTNKITVETANPNTTSNVISGNVDIKKDTNMAIYTLQGTAADQTAIEYLLEHYAYVGIKAGATDATKIFTLADDLEIIAGKTLYLGVTFSVSTAGPIDNSVVSTLDKIQADTAITVTVGNGKELTVTSAKVYDYSSTMTSKLDIDGALLLDGAYCCAIVDINSVTGYVSVKNAKTNNQDTDLGDDLRVGYGNTVNLNGIKIGYGFEVYVYGTLNIVNDNKVEYGGSIITYPGSTMNVKGSLAVEGTVITNGSTTVDGTVSVYRSGGNATWTNGGYATVSSGATFNVTKGTNDLNANSLTVGAKGSFTLYGTSTITGTIAGSIIDYGTLTINGTSDLATVYLRSGVSVNVVSVAGSILLCDNDAAAADTYKDDFSGYKDYVLIYDNNAFSLTNVAGVVVTETVKETAGTVKVGETDVAVKYYVSTLSITLAEGKEVTSTVKGGLFHDITAYGGSVENTTYKSKWSSSVSKGCAQIGDLAIGKNGNLAFAGANNITVSGNVTCISEGASIEFDNTTTNVTVKGQIYVNNDEGFDLLPADFAGKVNATYYFYDDSMGDTNYVLTDFGLALPAILTADDATVYIHGTQTISAQVVIPDDAKVTVANGSTMKVAKAGEVTISEDALVDGSEGTIEVVGILTVMDKEKGLKPATGEKYFIYQVKTENGKVVTYSGIEGALSRAVSGDVIEMYQSGTISSDATLKEGVKLIVPAKVTLTIGSKTKEVTFDVDGQLQILRNGAVEINGVTYNETTGAPVSIDCKKVTLIVDGSIIVDEDGKFFEAVQILADSGAIDADDYIGLTDLVYFQKKIDGRPNNILSNLTFASENVTEGYVVVIGSVSAGEIAFTPAKDKEIVIYVPSSYESDERNAMAVVSLALNNKTTIAVSPLGVNPGVFNGTILAPSVDGVATIAFEDATGFIFQANKVETATGDVYHAILDTYESSEVVGEDGFDGSIGILDGTVEVAPYSVGIAGMIVNENEPWIINQKKTSAYLYVGPDAALVIATGAYLYILDSGNENYDDPMAVFDGALYVNGYMDVSGYTAVNGLLTVAKERSTSVGEVNLFGAKAQMDLAGDLVISDDKTLYGTFEMYGGSSMFVGEDASVTGPLWVYGSSFINVYAGADVDGAMLNWDSATESSKAVSTDVYVFGVPFVTTYANASAHISLIGSAITADTEIIGCDVAGSYNAQDKETGATYYLYWFTDLAAEQNLKIGKTDVGIYDEVYFNPAAAKVQGKVTVGVGLTLYVDGKIYDRTTYSTEDYLTVGTHIVSVQVSSLYEGDNVTIKFNDKIVPVTAAGGTITVTPDMKEFTLVADGAAPYVPPEPEPTPTPEAQSEWTVTTILLCVLVVLIAIMAVIVALRLNRN